MIHNSYQFLVFACALCKILCQTFQIRFEMATFLFLAYFDNHFCNHSNGKSKYNTRCLHSGYCSYIFTSEGFVVSTFRQTLRLTTLKIYY